MTDHPKQQSGVSSPSGVTVRLRSMQDGLPSVAQRIVAFLLKNRERVVEMPVSEVAQELDVSVGSVVRVCQQIGLRLFQNLNLPICSASFWKSSINPKCKV